MLRTISFLQEMTDLSRKDQLIKLVMQIVPSQMKHHAEAEACDLLMEVERLDVLKQFVHEVPNFVSLATFLAMSFSCSDALVVMFGLLLSHSLLGQSLRHVCHLTMKPRVQVNSRGIEEIAVACSY